MRRTLAELREIATSVGLQILESEQEPASYYLVKQFGFDSSLIARINVEVSERTHFSLGSLAEALALAIEEFVGALLGNVQKHCRDVLEKNLGEPIGEVIAISHEDSDVPLSDQELLSLAQTLHELAKDLVKFSEDENSGAPGPEEEE